VDEERPWLYGIKLKEFLVTYINKDLTGVEIEVFLTRYCKHAYEHILSIDMRAYNGILCCSGDGIVHEVMNALYHRNDDSVKYAILGVIPGGSSNGLAKSICDESKENYSPDMCAYIIAKGQYKNIDVMEIEMKSSEKKIYASLNITYGIIADIDLNSEV
jgi:sphingosine kinase